MPEKQRILWAMIETKIKKRNSAGEFTVELFVDGIHQKEADYFTDDRKDAATTAADMLKRADPVVDLPKRKTMVKLESRIVTGNGWIAGLKEKEQREQFTASIRRDRYPEGVKGSPLGRGWSEEQAKADLIRRVIDESGIRLELYQDQPTKTN